MTNPPAWVLELLPKCDCVPSRDMAGNAVHSRWCAHEQRWLILSFLALVLRPLADVPDWYDPTVDHSPSCHYSKDWGDEHCDKFNVPGDHCDCDQKARQARVRDIYAFVRSLANQGSES